MQYVLKPTTPDFRAPAFLRWLLLPRTDQRGGAMEDVHSQGFHPQPRSTGKNHDASTPHRIERHRIVLVAARVGDSRAIVLSYLLTCLPYHSYDKGCT